MSQKLNLALGKNGDVIGILPILYHEFKTTNQKPVLLISKQYAPLLSRVPFVEPLVYPGDWQDLEGAMAFAKQQSNHVVCLSMFGRNFPMQNVTASFQTDAYKRAGCLELWDSLPLEGIKRGKPMKFKQPTILYADQAESAPFMQKEELYKLLVESFPGHHIERLGNHKLKHFFDFMEWYDASDALVTIDTAHLHLSAGSRKPVVALAADRPSRWKGSCWSKRFAFYCRYGEFMWRKEELVDCLSDALEGNKRQEIVCLN